MDVEDWEAIPNFSRYRVSNYGKIWNDRFDRLMVPSVATPQGHLKISLFDDAGNRITCSVAQLVAQAFVEPPTPRCDHVIHKDGDRNNVAASNLAWRTRRQAYLYSRQMQREPLLHWTNIRIYNVETGVEYDNVVHCGIIEGLLFHDIMNSALGYECVPPERRPVYPYGYTYHLVYRV